MLGIQSFCISLVKKPSLFTHTHTHLWCSRYSRARRDGLSHQVVVVSRRTCSHVGVGASRPGVRSPTRDHSFLWLPWQQTTTRTFKVIITTIKRVSMSVLEGRVYDRTDSSPESGLRSCDLVQFETIGRWFIMTGGLDANAHATGFITGWLRPTELVLGVSLGRRLTFQRKP